MRYAFDHRFFSYLQAMERKWNLKPLNLGGGNTGEGQPPGGFTGYLPQDRVSFDDDELEIWDIPPSGISLTTNLDRIRYRIADLEDSCGSGSGSGTGSISIYEDDILVASGVTIINFEGDAEVTDDGGGEVTITITGGTSIDGWSEAGETWTYASDDDPTFTFTIAAMDATAKYSPGMRIKLTQTTEKYFIITKVVFDNPDSTLTIYGGTDYNLTNAAITTPYYSLMKAPFGFPLSLDKWTVKTTDNTYREQASPDVSTWYNINATSISIPIGCWNLNYQVCCLAYGTQPITLDVSSTLSTANNSASDSELVGNVQTGYIAGEELFQITGMVNRGKPLILTSKTTYYLNAKTEYACDAIAFANDLAGLTIRVVCAYL